MESTKDLQRDHAVIKMVLAALRNFVDREELHPESVRNLVTFSQTFVDRCHHGKEERCLFPCLESRGVPKEGGPIGVMLMEHERGRQLVGVLRESLAAFEAGRGPEGAVLKVLASYVDHLEQHIWKEENILFAIAGQVMEPKADRDTVACYEETETQRVGPGVHEEMEALAQGIVRASRP